MRRALVIGASGQVGRAAARALSASGWDVVGTHASRPSLATIPLDLSRLEEVRACVRGVAPSVVVLCSAMTNVERCEDEPELAYALNAAAPSAIADAAREVGARVLFLSTEYVFDGTAGPYDEADRTNPLSIYGRSKLAGEQAVLRADPGNLALRTTVVYSYGKGEKNFVMQLLDRVGRGERMRVPADQVSSPTYAPDLAAAIARLADSTAAGVLNVAGPDVLGRYDFAVRAARILALDSSLLDPVSTSVLGQKAPRPLAAGLRTERLRALGISMRGVEDGARAFVSAARQG